MLAEPDEFDTFFLVGRRLTLTRIQEEPGSIPACVFLAVGDVRAGEITGLLTVGTVLLPDEDAGGLSA